MTLAVMDAECTGLVEHMLHDPSAQVHCVMFQEFELTGDKRVLGDCREFYDEARVSPDDRDGWTFCGGLDRVPGYLNSLDTVCGHNIIEYDFPVLRHHLTGFVTPRLIDSLVISRKNFPDREGGHSVDAWASRIGMNKPSIDEWHTFTPEIRNRCREDVLIETQLLFKVLEELRVNEEKCK